MNFLFDPAQLDAGASSRFFFLHTDATSFAPTATYDLLDQSQNLSGSFNTFAPAVPEPGTLALLGAGFVLVASMNRRRHRNPIR